MNIRLKSYLIILATFCLGATLGGFGAYAWLHKSLREMAGSGPHPRGPHQHGPGGPRMEPGRMLERHIMEIARPDKEQAAKLAPLLERFDKRFEEKRAENRRGMDSSMKALDSELATVLSPEQMKKWLARPRPHHGPGGPGERGPEGPEGPPRFGPPGREDGGGFHSGGEDDPNRHEDRER